MIKIAEDYLNAQKGRLTPSESADFSGLRLPNENASTLGISEGCVVEFPGQLEGNVVDVRFPGATNPTKAVLCKLYRDENDPEEKAEMFEFYLSTPMRAFTPIVNGRNQPREYTGGNVHDWFKRNIMINVNATMQAMCGKRMKFTNNRVGQYADPYRKYEIRGYSLWDINWVGDAPADVKALYIKDEK